MSTPSVDDAGPHSADPLAQGPDLSIIIPTFNESLNVGELVDRVGTVLTGVNWEIIFVDDDSPDGTARLVRDLARANPRVRCVHRIGRRGLSSACVEGMLASSAPYLAVMDGDLQHDEKLLPQMLDCLRSEPIDIVVGSRYVEGGSVGDWEQSRIGISRFATRVAQVVIKGDLKDPMSGFFMLRRPAFEGAVRNLSSIGFKILIDIFASSPEPLRFKELPFEFRQRHAGESKLDTQVVWDYGMLLLDKLIGHLVPVRFVAFGIVGGIGVVVHFFVLTLLFKLLGTSFALAQGAAIIVAMTGNFFLNNVITYRDMRLKGWQWLWGWLSFALACSVGALANIAISVYLHEDIGTHWALAAGAGVAIASVWNYGVTKLVTWRPRFARPSASL